MRMYSLVYVILCLISYVFDFIRRAGFVVKQGQLLFT